MPLVAGAVVLAKFYWEDGTMSEYPLQASEARPEMYCSKPLTRKNASAADFSSSLASYKENVVGRFYRVEDDGMWANYSIVKDKYVVRYREINGKPQKKTPPALPAEWGEESP